jgi:hypothetical protein
MKYIILGIVLLISICSYGQDIKKMDYQLDVGSTFTIPYKHITDVNLVTTKYNCGVGFFTEMNFCYNINDKYSLAGGVNYSFCNLKTDYTIGAERLKLNVLSQSINVHLEFRFKAFASKPFFVRGGGYVGTILSTKEKGTQYIDTTKLHPINIPPFQTTIDYNRTLDNGFILTYGLSARVDYIIKMNDKIGLVVFLKFSYGWSYWKQYKETNKDLNYNLLFGIGINI